MKLHFIEWKLDFHWSVFIFVHCPLTPPAQAGELWESCVLKFKMSNVILFLDYLINQTYLSVGSSFILSSEKADTRAAVLHPQVRTALLAFSDHFPFISSPFLNLYKSSSSWTLSFHLSYHQKILPGNLCVVPLQLMLERHYSLLKFIVFSSQYNVLIFQRNPLGVAAETDDTILIEMLFAFLLAHVLGEEAQGNPF